MIKSITASLAFFVCLSSLAQEGPPPPISGDRPGFGVSTLNMPAGLFQAEMGYMAELVQYPMAGISDWTHNVPLTFRYGITSWLEVKSDLAFAHDVFESFDQTEYSGLLPVMVGGRATVLSESESLPRVLLYGTVGIPLNESHALSSDLRLLLSKQLTSSVVVDANVGMLLGEQNVLRYSASGTAEATEGVSFFAEFYGSHYNRIHQGFIDGGLIFHPSPNVQIDVSAGRRLLIKVGNVNIAAEETYTFFSVGGAFRIPE